MTTQDQVDQLRYRRQRINELIGIADSAMKLVLEAELAYVDAMLEYAERYGRMPDIII